MDVAAVLLELYSRIPPLAERAVAGLDAVQLAVRPTPAANSIGWLVWHLARVQDHHVADLAGTDQVWVEGDWAARCGLAPEPSNIGYGHTVEEVATVRPEGPDVLIGYLRAVQGRTEEMVESLSAESLDRIVDRRWDPPVTMGVRLVSIADDSLQHVGQANYLRGVLGY